MSNPEVIKIRKNMIMDESAIRRALTRISHEILERNKGYHNLTFVGVRTRGVYLAERIAKIVETIEHPAEPMQVIGIDVTAYRDDIHTHFENHRHSTIGVDITGKKIILCDDVLYTGRTVRAAMDALIDSGRPENIQLAVLVDRGHRELPIRPDYVGKNVPTSRSEKVEVLMKEVDGADQVNIYQHREEHI